MPKRIKKENNNNKPAANNNNKWLLFLFLKENIGMQSLLQLPPTLWFIDLKNLTVLYTQKVYILICHPLLVLNIQTKSSDNVNRHCLVLLKLREKMVEHRWDMHFSWILIELHWELDRTNYKRKSELKDGDDGLIKCTEHEKQGKGETVERVWIHGTWGLPTEDCENVDHLAGL